MKNPLRSVPSIASVIVCVSCLFTSTSVRALTVSVAPGGNIQSAIDQVAAAGGGTVNITAGSGTVSSSLRMKSKVTLNGAGNPTTTLNAGGDFQVIQENSDNLSNVTVQNLKLNGRGRTGSTNCQGVYIESLSSSHNQAIKVSNVQALNFGGMGCHLKRADNSSIVGCNFHDNGATLFFHNVYVRESNSLNISGTQMNNSPIGSGLHVAGVTVGGSCKTSTCSGNGQNGQNIQDNPSNYTIDGCTANGNRNATAGRSDGIGFKVWGGSGVIKNCTATGNATANYQISGFTQSNNH